uniref:Pyridoxal phosphate homeostasis protein n=1 Tax=Arcella intermedia TaxID=1963864 RepID=A0A6B2LHK6_9EUKA
MNPKHQTRLVAVSKTKPNELIMAAYSTGHRHFGENYAQEIVTKSPSLPNDIAWHFIGHLQSNKVNKLVESVPNLWAVETVDSFKLASALSKAVVKQNKAEDLNIFIQVNTSGEEQKSGVPPEEAVELAKKIYNNPELKKIKLIGLMTIGALEGDATQDFKKLVVCREKVAEALGINPDQLELSMGMSHDFLKAIELGSTNVRIGSTIFGVRPQKQH